MNFEFKCPNCNHLITEKDFKENEKILNHLSEIFKQHKTEYIQVLKTKLQEYYKNEQIKSIKIALAEKENEQLKANQADFDKLNQVIAEQKNKIETNNAELEKVLAQHEAKLLREKHNEIILLNTKISELEKTKETQKLILEKLLVDKEKELIKLNQAELNKLNQVIAEQKNKIETNNVELEKVLAQHEIKLTKQTHEEINNLKVKISELEKANLQNKLIQNKTKGENFEHEIEAELRKVFEPDDIIFKITDQDKKADYLQEVRQDNNVIGRIVYEVKNAEWNNNWEKKLIDDMAKQNSKYGILIATSFNNKYPGIPFKRSDYNSNIYLTDSESFYFVGQILRTLIKIEYRLESNHNQKGYDEKIKYFNNWKATQLPKLNRVLEESCTRIKDSENSILKRVNDIRVAREKIYKNWIENIKNYLENFVF
ncbi:MAG: DUF2130 domain-containing protein [Spiroplasma sp.]